MKTKNGRFKEGTNELISYEKKGKYPIKVIDVSVEVFNDFYEDFKQCGVLAFTTNLEVFNNVNYGLWQKGLVLYYASPNKSGSCYRIVANGVMFAFNDWCKDRYPAIYNKTKDGSYDYCMVANGQTTTEEAKDATKEVTGITGYQAMLWGRKLIQNAYSKEEVEAIIQEFGLPSRPEPFRHRSIENNCLVQEWSNCIYQDIHKAHNSELIKIFPRCSKHWKNKAREASYFKSIGELSKAAACKNYPNYLVGYFNHKQKGSDDFDTWLYGLDTHTIYNRIVKDVYDKINDQYNLLTNFDSTLVYAQTDGLIISNPIWSNVKNSKELGEFGVETIDDGKVWTYHQDSTKEASGYTIYQFFTDGKKKVVGDLPNQFKDEIDLSVGRVVKFKKFKDEFEHISFKLLDVINTGIVKGE